MNLKKGITRLYIVVWGLWLLGIATKTAMGIAAGAHGGDLGMAMGTFAWLGLVLPGAFLIAVRWALDGFTDADASG